MEDEAPLCKTAADIDGLNESDHYDDLPPTQVRSQQSDNSLSSSSPNSLGK